MDSCIYNDCCLHLYPWFHAVISLVSLNYNGLLSDPEYIDIVYICLHANYLNKILFKPNYNGILG